MAWSWLFFVTNLISKILRACRKNFFLRRVVFARMLRKCLPEGTYVCSVEMKFMIVAQAIFVQCVTERKHSISEDIK